MFCALLTSRYQVSVYRTNGPLVSSENLHFYTREKLLYIAWASLRNVVKKMQTKMTKYIDIFCCKTCENLLSCKTLSHLFNKITIHSFLLR